MDNRYWLILLIPIVFIGMIYGLNNLNYKDNKYCDLSRIVDSTTAELHPAFYDMENQAENYLNGTSISGIFSGRLIGWVGDFESYRCVYDFTVKIGNISETIQVTHTFEGNELIEWRDAVDEVKAP